MPTYPYIILDAEPLGNVTAPFARAGVAPTYSQRCRQWIRDCEAAGTVFIVPAITYYEVVRDFYQRKAPAKIARLQNFCFDPTRFLPLATDDLTRAAELWGMLRNQGIPTAGSQSLDADVIFAAQVLSLNLPSDEYIVATSNPNHLSRFGLPVDTWENITP
jgi:predicted nucleic acid-binding protein